MIKSVTGLSYFGCVLVECSQPEFKMDNDPRFSAIFSDAKFAIDPSAPNFK